MFKRIASVIGLALTSAYLASAPAWNSLLAFFAALTAYVTIEITQHQERQKESEKLPDITRHIREIQIRPPECVVGNQELDTKHRQMLADADANMKAMALNMKLSIARLFLPSDCQARSSRKPMRLL